MSDLSCLVIGNLKLFGQLLDKNTRCLHYHSEIDIIAIKFKCCGYYFSCFKCHDLFRNYSINHPVEKFSKLDYGKVVLCGNCYSELTFDDYSKNHRCTICNSQFNPKCSLHYGLYFD